ncbi:hypothetical protein [Lactobacillus delbrueckii]|uniref:hypothetical protein n=1 Tax=Lactobacillus delbrueckii TaxID=1584 RepID=UPI003A8A3266
MVVRLRRQNLVTLYLSGQLLCFACLNQVCPMPLADSQDEILAVFCLIGIAWALLTKRLSKEKAGFLLKICFALALVESLGIISNGMSGLISRTPVLVDAFKLVKLPLVLFYVSCCLRPWEKRTLVRNLLLASKCFILLAFLGGIVNLAVDVGFSYDLRYGIRSYKFIYENPAALNEVLLVSLVLIMLGEGIGKKSKKNKRGLSHSKAWLLFYLATVVMTLRAGALGLIAFFLISSAGNPIFTSASGVFLAIALGLTSDFLQK